MKKALSFLSIMLIFGNFTIYASSLNLKDCYYNSSPIVVHLSPKKFPGCGKTICQGGITCKSNNTSVTLEAACTGDKGKCPSATKCIADQSITYSKPYNESDFYNNSGSSNNTGTGR